MMNWANSTSGEYAQIFEEEYAKLRDEARDLTLPEYDNYLMRDEPEKVHQGYFSIDKKGKSVDPTVKRGKEDSDDVSAYDLIMKGKEAINGFYRAYTFYLLALGSKRGLG